MHVYINERMIYGQCMYVVDDAQIYGAFVPEALDLACHESLSNRMSQSKEGFALVCFPQDGGRE